MCIFVQGCGLPFFAPPTPTPKRAITRTSLSSHGIAIYGPNEAKVVDDTIPYLSETEGTPIKRMGNNIICVPAATAAKAPGEANDGVVQLNPIGIDAVKRPRAVLFPCEAAGLVAREGLDHLTQTTTGEVDPTAGTQPKDVGKADAAPGSAIVNFGVVEESVWIGGQMGA